MPILTGKFFFHQISKEKSAAYYIRARAIVGQIWYSSFNNHIFVLENLVNKTNLNIQDYFEG